MAKKKKSSSKKSSAKKSKSSSSKKKVAKKKVVSKYKKKRGRKPSSPNRYNSIKSAISQYYQESVGRNIKRYELKVIYDWIKTNYGNQSLRYVLMNIDVILDNFWQEYCNLYPVNLENHARYFDWYYFKNFLFEEVEFHYPSDIIQVDLSQIGRGVYDFFMEDYVVESERLYQIGKESGLKASGLYPKYWLKNAYCDVARKGNVYEYVLLVDGEVPDEQPTTTPTTTPTTPTTTTQPPQVPTQVPQAPQVPTQEVPQEPIREESEGVIRARADLLKAQTISDALDMLRKNLINQEQFNAIIQALG